jgi:hypothetical protein
MLTFVDIFPHFSTENFAILHLVSGAPEGVKHTLPAEKRGQRPIYAGFGGRPTSRIRRSSSVTRTSLSTIIRGASTNLFMTSKGFHKAGIAIALSAFSMSGSIEKRT